jgi:hypothetical protein
MFRKKILWVLLGGILISCHVNSEQPETKPKLKVEVDGFPGGQDVPEGVACELARSFINRDAKLFCSISIRKYGAGAGPTKYVEFLQRTAKSIEDEAKKAAPSPGGPKKISKVYAARHLSKSGPASSGFAAFQFQEVMFVDVFVELHNGDGFLNRTLVIKDKDGKWYVHPAPDVSPLLSMGLNDETKSKTDFNDVYDIAK